MAINKDYVESRESGTEPVNEDSSRGKKTSAKDTKREEKSAIKSRDKSISQEPEPVVSNKDKSISQEPEPVVSNKRRTDKLQSVSALPSRPQEVLTKDDNHTNIQREANSDTIVTNSVAEAVEKAVGEVVVNVTDLSESKSTNNHELYTNNPFLSAVNFWQTSVLSYLDTYRELSINAIRLTQNWYSCFFPNLYPWLRLNQ
ncbi:MAG TPA: hypothetical protein VH796_04535 [Nitrososphaeraceae archaeon]